jgi:hypothetical protein
MVIAEPSEAVEKLPQTSAAGGLPAFSMAVCLIGTLVLGIFAEPVMTLSRQAVAQMASSTVITTAVKAVPQHLSQAK